MRAPGHNILAATDAAPAILTGRDLDATENLYGKQVEKLMSAR
jgi:hypothetical protein